MAAYTAMMKSAYLSSQSTEIQLEMLVFSGVLNSIVCSEASIYCPMYSGT
jgi:hypothetical protein